MMYVETSPDGQTWTREGTSFRFKSHARNWFDEKFPRPEWRVGFLVRQDGIQTRLVDDSGEPVKS